MRQMGSADTKRSNWLLLTGTTLGFVVVTLENALRSGSISRALRSPYDDSNLGGSVKGA
jgi:hypothetical protein